MPRCFVLFDRTHRLDLLAALREARAALTRGGSREQTFEIVRPPFAAVVLSLGNPDPIRDRGDEIHIDLGAWPEPEPEPDRSGSEPGRLESGTIPATAPCGRRARIVWSAKTRQLRVHSDPHGQLPLYYFSPSPERALVASEPKAIHAVHDAKLELDADGLLELFEVGHLVAQRTLFRDVHAVAPGTVLCIGPEGQEVEAHHELRFSDERGGSAGRFAREIDRSLAEVMKTYHRAAPRMTVALSGGLDSRLLLAAARREWRDLDAITFGAEGSADVDIARAVAQAAHVPHRHRTPAATFLSDWAGYAVWRADGMESCLHAHGMDAVIASSESSPQLMNGMGGDLLMGAFLRPEHLAQDGDPVRAARFVARTMRPTACPLESIFKPALLERATTRPQETLVGTMRLYPHARLGNVLIGYWLRHRCARLTSLGLALEAPFVEYWTPFVDPRFVDDVARLPLEARFMSRAQRRALSTIAPELSRIPWERLGVAPHWPWPVLGLAKLGRRLGLVPRSRPVVDYPNQLRTTLRSWVERVLLDPRTRDDGYFLPGYLERMVGEHADGAVDRTAEIGMAVTIELSRRMFVERDLELAAPPPAIGLASSPGSAA